MTSNNCINPLWDQNGWAVDNRAGKYTSIWLESVLVCEETGYVFIARDGSEILSIPATIERDVKSRKSSEPNALMP